MMMEVIQKDDGYHEFGICPIHCFDRWANSRHIVFRLMVENYTEEKGFGWKKEDVEKDFVKHLKDAEFLCEELPERMFNSFIKIEM